MRIRLSVEWQNKIESSINQAQLRLYRFAAYHSASLMRVNGSRLWTFMDQLSPITAVTNDRSFDLSSVCSVPLRHPNLSTLIVTSTNDTS
jgi:hypothetical protein